jgi:hypothetical protein
MTANLSVRGLCQVKLIAWLASVDRGTAMPSFEKFTNANNIKLLEAQSDVVEMAHMALGHLEALKKKELVLAALTMTQEEFDNLAADRNQLIVESSGNDHPTTMLRFLLLSWLSRCPMFSPTNQLTRLGTREELWGMKGGLSSVNSYNIMANHALMCSP